MDAAGQRFGVASLAVGWSRLAQLIVYPSCRGEHILCNQLELARVGTINVNNGDIVNLKVEVSRELPC